MPKAVAMCAPHGRTSLDLHGRSVALNTRTTFGSYESHRLDVSRIAVVVEAHELSARDARRALTDVTGIVSVQISRTLGPGTPGEPLDSRAFRLSVTV